MHTLRIDPLNEAGEFDGEFFTSKYYNLYISHLKKYLKDEGFSNTPGEYMVTLPMNEGPATWHVVVSKPVF